ncbi:exodeoxyribonuclease VII small subunit [Lacticigenium naphthae]|uniref:exodeoxyribonuclease VII small subunit n=1 Tax=Lacticigenium naphthae TaxID=515351 RepID=UPI0003F8A492|nr:exodeoxyribonuclease VII small subunit [Lacticigenium naphthae]
MTKKEKKFEDSLNELEGIVDNLERGDIPLEEALDSFKKGITLSKKLKKTLQDAEETLTKIVDENGEEIIFENELETKDLQGE